MKINENNNNKNSDAVRCIANVHKMCSFVCLQQWMGTGNVVTFTLKIN